MSFKKDIPNFNTIPDDKLYMHTVPSKIWMSLDSLIRKSASSNSDMLKEIINTIAEITGGQLTNNWGWDYLENDIPQCVSDIRRKTEKMAKYHFDSFMDSLAVLVNVGDLSCEDINEFLEDNEIGYYCEKSFGGNDVVWYRVGSDESKNAFQQDEESDSKMINNIVKDKRINSNMEYNLNNQSEIELVKSSKESREDKEDLIINSFTKPSVFISYNWGSEQTVDVIEKELKIFADVRRDKSSITPWGSISGFMKEIRKTDLVVVVISDEYLKSVNCLFEIMQLIKDENWISHSMFIVEDSAKKIYKPIEQVDYVKYWETESEKLKNKIKDMDIALVTTQAEELKKIELIKLHIGQFLKDVSDRNNPDVSKAIEAIISRVRYNIREQETEGE